MTSIEIIDKLCLIRIYPYNNIDNNSKWAYAIIRKLNLFFEREKSTPKEKRLFKKNIWKSKRKLWRKLTEIFILIVLSHSDFYKISKFSFLENIGIFAHETNLKISGSDSSK